MDKGRRKDAVLVLEGQVKAALVTIESCRRQGLHVIVGAPHRFCSGMMSRCCDERFVYPAVQERPDEFLTVLEAFLERRRVEVLFPMGQEMTPVIVRHQERLRALTRLVVPPAEVFERGHSKVLTLKAAAQVGCPTPKTWYPAEEGIERVAEKATYPVLVKPAVASGARGITLCRTGVELRGAYERTVESHGESFVQEFVPSGGGQYKVDVVLGRDQELLAGVTYSKLRFYPPDGGSSVLNRTEDRPEILVAAVKLARHLGWVGICDFDFIGDPRDGVVKLMEINPRPPESYGITAAAGVDMPKLLYELALGRGPTAQLDYEAGRYLRFLYGDGMWFLRAKGQRWRAEPSFFNFFRRDTVYQLARLWDWGPMLGYLLENASMLWDRRKRRFRLR